MKRFALLYMVFIIAWFGGAMAATKLLGLDAVASLGIGVAGGVFVAEFRTIIDVVVSQGAKDNRTITLNKPEDK